MTPRRTLGFALIAALAIGPALAGAEEDRYEIRFARQQADGTREFLAGYEADAKAAGEFMQEDLVEVRQYLEGQIAGWDRVVSLYKDGKADEAKMEFDKRANIAPNLWKSRGRIEQRRRQQDATPTEMWYTRELENLPAASLAPLEAWCEARKKYAESIGELAKVWMPESTDTQIREVADKVRQLQVEAEIAEWTYRWSRENADLLRDRNLSPTVNEKVSAVQQTEEQLNQIRRQRAELERKWQQVEQVRREQINAANKARDAAVRARDEAQRELQKKPSQ